MDASFPRYAGTLFIQTIHSISSSTRSKSATHPRTGDHKVIGQMCFIFDQTDFLFVLVRAESTQRGHGIEYTTFSNIA